MKAVGRVLSSGMQGDDVRELQDQLERLDFFIPPAERNNGRFGPVTKKAVMNVQRRFFFEKRVTGIVDQATANVINREARNAH
jgi:peptidoglycan hydrolase-like protein with peptidoglycan-binding domain